MNSIPTRMNSPHEMRANLTSLDLARGSMATLVFLSHAALFTGAVGDLRMIFRLGGVAVEIFMFISGFLMMWHYILRQRSEPWEAPETWGVFWLRRFFRMAPLYWFVLTLIYLFHDPLREWLHHVHDVFPLPWEGREVSPERVDWELGWGNAASHYLFVFGLIPKWASNNVLPDWSITLEMQFYFIFPFMALAVKKIGWAVTMIFVIFTWQLFDANVGVGLLSGGGAWGWYPMPTILPLSLGAFFAGMLAAGGLSAWFREGHGILAFAASVGLAFWCDKLLAAFVFFFLLWEICGTAWGRSLPKAKAIVDAFLECKCVRLLADCSYGIYLCHSLVLLGMLWIFLQWEDFTGLNPLDRFLLLTAASTPFVIGVSFACHRWIETPGIKAGKIISRRFRNKNRN